MACDICLGKNEEKCPVCGTERKAIECPHCKGYGIVDCVAYMVGSGDEEYVTAATFLTLPESEVMAMAKKQKYYKGEAETCPVCNGGGKVYEDAEGEYYPAT